MSVLNIIHRLETSLLTKKSENILERRKKKRQRRTHWILNQICPRLDIPCLQKRQVFSCPRCDFTLCIPPSTSHDGSSGDAKCGWMGGADLHKQSSVGYTRQNSGVEGESGPGAAAPTDRHAWPSLRARPLPKCLPAPHTSLYFNPFMTIPVGLAAGHPELNLTLVFKM